MKKKLKKNAIYLIAGAAVLLLLTLGYVYIQSLRPAPFEPGGTIEATSVELDGNAGE